METPEIREYTAEELDAFWFDAVCACGWQTDGALAFPGGCVRLGQYKTLCHTDERLGLRYTDIWWDGPVGTDTFHGVAMIQRLTDGATLWTMHYVGWMKLEAEELVKTAIRSAVQRGIFAGGRGSEIHTSRDSCYINTFNGGFESFAGVEYCTRLGDNARTSEVHYSGGMMTSLVKS